MLEKKWEISQKIWEIISRVWQFRCLNVGCLGKTVAMSLYHIRLRRKATGTP